MKEYSKKNKEKEKYYLVCVDITKAFDTINQKKLYEIIESILKEEQYIVQKYILTSPYLGKVRTFYHKISFSAENPQQFPQIALKMSNNTQIKNSAFTDQVSCHTIKRETILENLQKQIFCNVVKCGSDFFLQCNGIPQGSILSSLLCSLYFGDMERKCLGFLKTSFVSSPSRSQFDSSSSNKERKNEKNNSKKSKKMDKNDEKSFFNDNNSSFSLYNGVLMRFIDDFFYLTNCKESAISFLKFMENENNPYNFKINSNKTKTNFDCHLSNNTFIKSFENDLIPWCGYLFDPNTLEVYADYSKIMSSRKFHF